MFDVLFKHETNAPLLSFQVLTWKDKKKNSISLPSKTKRFLFFPSGEQIFLEK